MASVRQQYMSIQPNETEDIEAIPIVKKPKRLRKILKCPAAVLEQQELSPSALKFVFGPLYCQQELFLSYKDEAWEKILKEEGGNQEKTKEIYMSAMRRIEKQARDAYGDEALNGLTESEFRWMMIKDGCYFLQLALHMLGASKQLGYPKDHLIFTKRQSKKILEEWINSMFYVGNKVPLMVLNELMKLSFFQKVINGVQWKRPSDMLCKQILYDLLVIPAREYSIPRISSNPLKEFAGKTYSPGQEQPSDLLHGLQLFMLGTGGSRKGSTKNEPDDELEHGDLEIGIAHERTPNAKDKETEDKQNKDHGDKRKKISASQLRNKAIFIKKSETAGSRGIDFKARMIFGRLILPTLKVNHDTNLLFTNLKYYEMAHKQNEVTSYLSFLSELVSSYEDINILAKTGIIEASKPEEKVRFLKMLKTISEKEMTPHHLSVIVQIKDYSPWERVERGAIILFVFTVIQTVFGVLGFWVGLEQLLRSSG